MYRAKILADSITPAGCRLTTFEIEYPGMVEQDLLRHRSCSFSVASTRAIPTPAYIRKVIDDPASLVWWGRNQPGMKAERELTGWRRWMAEKLWLWPRWFMLAIVQVLYWLGLHKQAANRLLRPWCWCPTIITATDWTNLFALRCHPDAQPELRKVVEMMRDLYLASKPKTLRPGEWHLPLIDDFDDVAAEAIGEHGVWDMVTCKGQDLGAVSDVRSIEPSKIRSWCPECRAFLAGGAWFVDRACGTCHATTVPVMVSVKNILLAMMSAARCARISLLRHGERRTIQDEMQKARKLWADHHCSPFEHQAMALDSDRRCANLRGWKSLRSHMPNEHDFSLVSDHWKTGSNLSA